MAENESKITKIQELVYEIKIKEVMKRDVITVSPQVLMSELRNILRSHRISGTPVVDGDKLVGVISLEDFIKWLDESVIDSEGAQKINQINRIKRKLHRIRRQVKGINCPIAERMSRDVITLYEDEPVIHAINKFDEFGFGRFPVIERQHGSLVGMITKGNIIEGLLRKLEIDYQEEEIHRYRASHIFEDIIADKTTLTFQYFIKGKKFNQGGISASGLKKTLRRLGIPPPILRRVSIIAYETEMNIIVFAEKGKIVAKLEPEGIKIEAEDTGPGISDIEKAMQPGYSTAPEWVREMGFGAGMGLNNIRKCADKMDLKSTVGKGTRLDISINISPL